MDFLHGMLVVLMPSMLVTAWLVWRASSKDTELLDHHYNQLGDSVD
jgi:hypothetical protein